MRGKGQWLHKTFRCSRITPAHAGKSRLAGKVLPARRDHPRARGEKAGCLWLGRVREGSPPHTRGKEVHLVRHIDCHGITPAHAGKSRCWWPRSGRRWDHPRACGEKGKAAKKKFASSGSPPRVRGKALSQPGVIAAWGITPARAGKRYGSSCESSTHRDHPRACGEKSDTGI